MQLCASEASVPSPVLGDHLGAEEGALASPRALDVLPEPAMAPPPPSEVVVFSLRQVEHHSYCHHIFDLYIYQHYSEALIRKHLLTEHNPPIYITRKRVRRAVQKVARSSFENWRAFKKRKKAHFFCHSGDNVYTPEEIDDLNSLYATGRYSYESVTLPFWQKYQKFLTRDEVKKLIRCHQFWPQQHPNVTNQHDFFYHMYRASHPQEAPDPSENPGSKQAEEANPAAAQVDIETVPSSTLPGTAVGTGQGQCSSLGVVRFSARDPGLRYLWSKIYELYVERKFSRQAVRGYFLQEHTPRAHITEKQIYSALRRYALGHRERTFALHARARVGAVVKKEPVVLSSQERQYLQDLYATGAYSYNTIAIPFLQTHGKFISAIEVGDLLNHLGT